MLSKIQHYIHTHKLLSKQGRYLVALSGGADSVALLRVMLSLGYRVHAVHCNFHLRGEESQRDELFCRDLCEQLSVPFHVTHFDTRFYADTHKVSIEMAARDLRYSYFEQMRVTLDADGILVAHHSDDNAETVLMNIIRGTGLRGLQGIRPRNGYILRPMLCVCRQDITDWLTLQGQSYITDSSNLEADVTRNKIRLQLLPWLTGINPAAIDNINRLAANMAEVSAVVEQAERQAMEQCMSHTDTPFCSYDVIDLRRLREQPSAEHALYAMLTPFHMSPAQIRQIHEHDSASGRIWQSPTHTVATDRQNLIIEANTSETTSLIMPETGRYRLPGTQLIITAGIVDSDPERHPSRQRDVVTLDASKVQWPITIRPCQPGDRLAPFGMKGTQLVSNYLTNRKRNYAERRHQLVAVDAAGQIIWLIGERASARHAFTQSTTQVLTLSYTH